MQTIARQQTIGNRLWRFSCFLVAAIVLLPIMVIFAQWGTLGLGEQEIWTHLFSTKIDRLLVNTLLLVVGVGSGVTLLGVSLAWLTTQCDFPGRKIFDWALMLPLAIPGYVMAFVFLGLLNYAGPVQTSVRAWFGQDAYFPDVQGSAGVITVLSLVLYPYVYLLARSAFVVQGRCMMDAARVLGLSPWQAFIRVAVPIARPAIVAGVALSLMETLADFGAVSVFNYDTFTTAIYSSWYGLFNLTVAAQLASLLLLFVAVTLFLEKYSRDKAKYTLDQRRKNYKTYKLKGLAAWAACLSCLLVLVLAFLIPFLRLLMWCFEAGLEEVDGRYFGFLGHTLSLGIAAAFITVMMALLLAVVKRMPARPGSKKMIRFSIRLATLGYALPGSVLAVGIYLSFQYLDQAVGFIMQNMFGVTSGPILVNGLFALVLAYSTRFLAVAYSPVESNLERIRISLVESAKSLGASQGRIVRKLYIPLLRPGLITAFIIVLVDVMKEMPATLLMRPFGWDTLAVRIFQMTAEGQWARAALPAVSLILLGLVPVILLIKTTRAPSE